MLIPDTAVNPGEWTLRPASSTRRDPATLESVEAGDHQRSTVETSRLVVYKKLLVKSFFPAYSTLVTRPPELPSLLRESAEAGDADAPACVCVMDVVGTFYTWLSP